MSASTQDLFTALAILWTFLGFAFLILLFSKEL